LDFSHNNLKEVIGADSLALLHDLDLSNNQLGTLDLGSLPTSLKALNLRSNRIERIVGNFDGRENLRFLDLGHNALTEFPSGLELLTGLNELLLSNNFLEEISGAIGNLTLLERLDLRKNRLRSLPNSLSNLNRLLYLDLEDNLLTELFDLLSRADWDDTTIRLRGNPLHQERRKLSTLTH
jgi:Leucine-rich repeat (LRR) protein